MCNNTSHGTQPSPSPPPAEENQKMLGQIREKVQNFLRNEFSVFHLLNSEKPWVLVDQGSFLGGFDWVPIEFRQGPWNILVCLYLAVMAYSVGLATVYCVWAKPALEQTTKTTDALHYFPAYSSSWWCNLAGLIWTSYVAHNIVHRGGGWASWMTFTVQSWTLIQLRCFLAVFSPVCPSLAVPAEYLRLPMLGQSTVTFLGWNLLLGPIAYWRMDTPYKRQKFVEIFTNFRLTQLHVFNILFALLQGIWGSPGRDLTELDLCVACLFVLAYACFYLFLLDRLGIHLYLVYSPRTTIAIVTWSLTYVAMYLSYYGWGYLISNYGSVAGSVPSGRALQ